MALQMILGESGAGKSHWLREYVIERSATAEEQQYLVLVPEQFTMQTQKALVNAHPRKGIMNIDVLSFIRLAHRVFEEVGESRFTILDDIGKNLILRKVAIACEGELKTLGKNLHRIGAISEVKSILSELTQYGVEISKLDEVTGELGQGELFWKLKDLRRIYQGFEDYLGEHYITKEELLAVLCRRIRQSAFLKNSTIVLDGYTGFTPVQLRLLRELLLHCREVKVAVTIDGREETDKEELFSLSRSVIKDLTRLAKEERIEVLPPVVFEGETAYRFRENPVLHSLERNLFRRKIMPYQKEQEQVRIFCATSMTREVELVAGQILKLVRQEGYRYREIGVVVSDVGAYANDIEEIFTRDEIPFFLDYKRNVLSNAFAEYVRSLFAMADEGLTRESVFRFLRTGLFDISQEQLDLLENYVLAVGIRGYKAWQRPWHTRENVADATTLGVLNSMRVQFVERMDGILQVLRNRRKTVEDITRGLYEFFVQEEIEKKLFQLQEAFQGAGRLALAKEYGQIYRIVLELLDQFVELLGEERVSLAEYRVLLDAGLEEARVGVIPPCIDQVNVGDLTRSRMEDVKAVLLLGASDHYLPGDLKSSGLLSQWDREKIKQQGVALSPSPQEKLFQQQFYLYQNLTKPTEKLYLFYSSVQADGKGSRPSYLLEELCRIFPKLIVDVRKEDEVHWEELSVRGGISLCARGLQSSELQQNDVWRGLVRWYLKKEPWREEMERYLEASRYRCPGDRLSGSLARELYGEQILASVTRLEKFSSCAFAHFLSYGLFLKERKEHGFEAADFGTVLHNALERYGKKVAQSGKGWTDLSEERQNRLIEESIEESAGCYGNSMLLETARSRYLLGRMKTLMKRTVWALTCQLSAGKFVPDGYEVSFGRGTIDRLDIYKEETQVYVKIMDYKTSGKAFDMTALYHGLQLQLVVYLREALALEQKRHPEKEVVPAGIFYYHVTDPLVKRQENSEKLARELLKELRVNGLLSGRKEVLKGLDSCVQGDSLVAPFGLKQDGSLLARSKVLSDEEFETVMTYTAEKQRRLIEAIQGGEMGIAPYEMGRECACTYCPYGDICRFDRKVAGYEYRRFKKCEQEEILERMRNERKE